MEIEAMNEILLLLEEKYPKIIDGLRKTYAENRSEMDMTESEYVLAQLPFEIEKGRTVFRGFDKASRMDAIARKFLDREDPEICLKYWPTGFEKLDAALGGGFTDGIHFIGAISSLGKSTMALQMAYNLALRGYPVMYVSAEMKKIDLVAKLISMELYRSLPVNSPFALTSTQLRNDSMRRNMPAEQWSCVCAAAEKVADSVSRITVFECQSSPMSADDIYRYVVNYNETYGNVPFLIIDYLQILSPPKLRKITTDKQIVDYAVALFRGMAVLYEMPVVIISALNRDGYSEPVSFKSFKDSGSIEYSSDTLIGLQFKGVGDKNFDIAAAKSKNPRDVELVILKQRYGPANVILDYEFYSKFSFFREPLIKPRPAVSVSAPVRI